MKYWKTIGICVAIAAISFAWVGYHANVFGRASRPILPTDVESPNLKKALFAAGCFWGVEASFRGVDGVVKTMVGYSGGQTPNPTYQQVCSNTTGHAESVMVWYDPSKVSYARLLDVFWSSHDPVTSLGPDATVLPSHRSAIFFEDAEQERTARASLNEVEASGVFSHPIGTEIVAASTFYPAEEEHQHFVERTGGQCGGGVVKVYTQLAKIAETERESRK